jgi:Amino acid permease
MGLGRSVLLHNACRLGHGRGLVGSVRGVNCGAHKLTTSTMNQLSTVSCNTFPMHLPSISSQPTPVLVLLSSPTSGGPYFWSAKLSTEKGAPFAAWITGWFNLLGQVAVTTGISYACATFLSMAVAMGDSNYVANQNTILGIYAAVLVSQVRPPSMFR